MFRFLTKDLLKSRSKSFCLVKFSLLIYGYCSQLTFRSNWTHTVTICIQTSLSSFSFQMQGPDFFLKVHPTVFLNNCILPFLRKFPSKVSVFPVLDSLPFEKQWFIEITLKNILFSRNCFVDNFCKCLIHNLTETQKVLFASDERCNLGEKIQYLTVSQTARKRWKR